MPVVSTVRSTPLAAETVPMASMFGVHVIGSTLAVDTVNGLTGMLAKKSSIALSRKRLKPTMPPQTITSRMNAMMKRLIKVIPLGRLF
jgi:hypothetical protein